MLSTCDRYIRNEVSQVIARLRNDLINNCYLPGERLPEIPLAKKLGVSRGRIREALKQLVHEGLLKSEPNCGVSVAQEASKEVRQLLWPMRMQLEVYALRCCYDDLGANDFLYWNKLLKHMQSACKDRDYSTLIEIEINFHRSIFLRANLGKLLPIWSLIIGRCLPGLQQFRQSMDDLGYVYETHMKLLSVLRRGDKDNSALALQEHIADGEVNRKRMGQRCQTQRSKNLSVD